MLKLIKKYLKYFNKNGESPYLKYWDVNNLYDLSEKLPLNDFKRVDDISELDVIFIKSHNEESDEEHFLEEDIQYRENLHNTTIYHFFQKEWKFEKLVVNLRDKTKSVIYTSYL